MTQGGMQEYIFMSMSSCGMLSDTLDVLVFEDEQLVIQPDSTITLCAPADTVCLSVSFAAPECIVWTDLDGNELGTGEELCVVPPLGESQYIASVPDLDCVASDTVTIMVSELPPPPLPDTTFKLCVGDTLKYELADYPFPYQWKDINGNILTSDSSLCEVMTQGGTQQYIFMSMSSCGMLSDTLDVLVFEDEQLVIQPDSTITLCAPADTVCLSVSFAAPECIVWTDLDGNELGTGEELCVVPPLGESQYIASVPDLDCVASDTVTIMVSELPPPPLPDTTFKLCVGDTLKYELADYPFPYQWKDINGNVLASDSSLCEVMTQGGTQQYIFMSMSSCGMLSDTLDVLVFEDEQLVIQPDSTITLCAPADTVCLSVSFAAPECIVWTDLDGNELGTGEELCVVPPLGESQYIASVPGLDCVASDTVTIMVSELPPPPLPDTTFKLCVGDTLKYELADYPFPYQWKDINGNILTSDSSLCEVMTQGGMQEYIFMSMSSCGMLSDTLEVLVFEEEALVIQPDSTITLCAPADTVCLSVSFAAPECIVWTDLDGNELGTGEELCVVPPLGESQYIASVPDLDCIASDTVTIMVSELPPPPLPDTTFKLCVGDTLKYELADYPFPYQWKDINGNVLTSDSSLCEVMPQGGIQQYIFMSMSSCGMLSDTLDVLVFEDEQLVIQPDSTITLCAPADTVCLSVSFAAPECIVWTDLDGNELGTGEELCVVPPLGESQYIASVPGLACITSDTVTIMVSELPPPPLPDTTFKLCVGDTLKYELADYPFPYQWKDINGNVLTSDSSLCEVMTQGGMQEYIFMSMSSCGMLSDTLDVLVFEDEQLVIQPDSTITLCAPADTVCLSVSFAAPECIVWTDLDGNELGTGEELCVVPPLGESQYIASVPDLACIASDTVTIMVSELPPPPLPDTTFKLCVGDTLKYELADYPFPYQWKDINGNVLTSDSSLCEVMTQGGMQEYIFMSMSSCGMLSDTLDVLVFEDEQLVIQPDSTITLCAPADTVCLSVSFAAPECIVWTDLDGNELGTGEELCVVPPLGESQYIASVPDLDCVASDTVTIMVSELPPPPLPDTTFKLCVGDTLKYELADYPFPYQWKDINGNILTSDSSLCEVMTQGGMQEYIFMSMSSCGMLSDTLDVLVFEDEQLVIQPDSTITLCAPADTVCLSVSFAAPECIVWTDLDGNELGTGEELCVVPPLGESQYIASVPGLACITSDTVTIMVSELPPPPLPDTTFKLCVGDTLKYELADYPFPYQWKDINGNILTSDSSLCEVMTQGGMQEYIFMSMSSCGMLSDTLDVLVFEDEQLVIQPDSTITLCAPADTVCLSVSFAAPECIVWTDLDGNELGTGEELCVVPPLGESQYIASVPDLDCVASDTVTIMVSELPPPPLPDTTFKLCVGDTLKYELADYPFPYQWKDINGNVLASDSSLCEVMTQGGTQQYIFMSMSSCGMLSDTLDVLVFEDEQLVIQPDSTITLCAPADTVCLSVSFAAPECIVWTDLDGNELGTGEELCVVPPLGESQYIASVPGLACITSDTVTIMVSELPPPPLPDTTFKLCVGDTLKYELADYPFPYQWKDINGNVLASDSSLCEVMTQGGTQQYIFMSMSSCGMLSDTLDVLVFEDEQLVIQPDSTITLCAPADTVCLSVSFAAPECIVWTDLDGNELGTGEELCVVPPLGESQYIASVPDLACITSDTVTIMVSELPPPPLPDTTFKLCVGDTLKYELADYPFPYQWKDINGNVSLASD
jgi:hypothetical protein